MHLTSILRKISLPKHALEDVLEHPGRHSRTVDRWTIQHDSARQEQKTHVKCGAWPPKIPSTKFNDANFLEFSPWPNVFRVCLLRTKSPSPLDCRAYNIIFFSAHGFFFLQNVAQASRPGVGSSKAAEWFRAGVSWWMRSPGGLVGCDKVVCRPHPAGSTDQQGHADHPA